MGIPKRKKYPKKPKLSASLEAWQRYNSRVKEIDSDYKKQLTEQKKKETLIKKLRK